MNESEARDILRAHSVEFDVIDGRTCIEVVIALGLKQQLEVEEVRPTTDVGQAENLTTNVERDKTPYFVQ